MATNGYGDNTMRRNEARKWPTEDPIDENTMEAQIARLESDVSNIRSNLSMVQVDVRELRNGLAAANEAISDVKNSVTALHGKMMALGERVGALGEKVDANIGAVKWMLGVLIVLSIGTPIATALHWI